MPSPPTTLGKILFLTRLEAERAKRGLSQVAMAVSLGVKPGRYKGWEYQASQPRDELTRDRLERRFKLPLRELFEPAVITGGEIQSLPNTK